MRAPRAPGPDAPRVVRQDDRIPRALFRTPERRGVAVELAAACARSTTRCCS
jgi:hypothetical protein